MSFAEKNLYAFIDLLQNQSSLFSEAGADLDKLCTSLGSLSDNAEQLSDAITTWCQEHPKILEELRKTRRSLFPQSAGEKAPGSKEGQVKPPDFKANKQTLQNAIQQSSSGGSQPSKSGS